MTLRINRTITLDLDKDLHREEEYSDISFTTPAGFTITPVDNRGNPVDLVEAGKVKITCTTYGDTKTPTTIQVLADGTVAGAIDIRHPEPKTITVKTVILEAKGGRIDNDVSRLVNKTTREKLEEYFKAVLDPAQIDIQLVDDTPKFLILPP
ncbi:hypothetical protein [Aquimarina sediminis]|uniref:hypothetical protein n=1 Tax=Aquimarina sediminis TaxID=2070536 RepID=UPI000CA02002|nr:hypothetical protein [Aquimarina sediminis]